MTKIKLERVKYMPKELQPEVLYVSEEFDTAAHLCACGCGAKIRTPLGPTEWSFTNDSDGPSLFPSIGNWQQKCRSHYWITKGNIRWADQWSDEQIIVGRHREEQRRNTYYSTMNSQEFGLARRLWAWLCSQIRN